MVGWLSYGVGNLKSTTSPPHAIEGSVFHVERGCVTCLGWGGVFMGAGLFRSFWFYGDVVVSRGTWAMLKYDSASQDIDARDHSLEVWKSKLNGIFF